MKQLLRKLGLTFAPKKAKCVDMSQPVTIKWIRGGGQLAEIYSTGMQISFFNEELRQCHQFVMCKDFLHDAVHATVNNGVASIYGFSYSPKSNPKIGLDKTRFLVTNSKDSKMMEKIPAVLDFLNQIEKHLKLKRTIAAPVANPPEKYRKCGVVALEASERWLIAPPMLSMYTLLLRCAFTHKIGTEAMTTIDNIISGKIKPYQTNDAGYLSSAKNAIDKIMKLGYRVFFFGEIEKNYPKEVSINTLHNSAGIVSLSQQSTRSICKHWTRKQIQERLDGTYVPKSNTEVVKVD